MNARTDGADSVNDPRSGNEIMAEAFEAFDKWRSEHDPDGDLDVIEAAKIYAFGVTAQIANGSAQVVRPTTIQTISSVGIVICR